MPVFLTSLSTVSAGTSIYGAVPIGMSRVALRLHGRVATMDLPPHHLQFLRRLQLALAGGSLDGYRSNMVSRCIESGREGLMASMLSFWGVPNLQVINEDAHAASGWPRLVPDAGAGAFLGTLFPQARRPGDSDARSPRCHDWPQCIRALADLIRCVFLGEGLVKLEAVALRSWRSSSAPPDLTTARRIDRFIAASAWPMASSSMSRLSARAGAHRPRAEPLPARPARSRIPLSRDPRAALFRCGCRGHRHAVAARLRRPPAQPLDAAGDRCPRRPEPGRRDLGYAAAIAQALLTDRQSSQRPRQRARRDDAGLLAYLRVAARAVESIADGDRRQARVTRSLEALMALRVPNGMFVRGHTSPRSPPRTWSGAGRAFLGAASIGE